MLDIVSFSTEETLDATLSHENFGKWVYIYIYIYVYKFEAKSWKMVPFSAKNDAWNQ